MGAMKIAEGDDFFMRDRRRISQFASKFAFLLQLEYEEGAWEPILAIDEIARMNWIFDGKMAWLEVRRLRWFSLGALSDYRRNRRFRCVDEKYETTLINVNALCLRENYP